MLSRSTKSGLRIIFITNLFVFVIVPLFLKISKGEYFVYYDTIPFHILIMNFIFTLPSLFISFFIDENQEKKNLSKLPNFINENFIRFLIISWIFVFLILGGVQSRLIYIPVLRIPYLLLNTIVILAGSLFACKDPRKISFIDYSLVTIFVSVFFLGQSRGIPIKIILSFVLVSELSKYTISKIRFNWPLKINKALKIDSYKKSNKFTKKIFYLLIIFIFILVFAFIGYYRIDVPNKNIFNFTLWRFSEPYWYFSHNVYLIDGPDSNVLTDTLRRIFSIVGRLLGGEYNFDIKGSADLISEKLSINIFKLNNLPITLLGQGILYNGYSGAYFFKFIAILIYIFSIYLSSKLPLMPKNLKYSLISFQVLKAFDIYPATLSGIVLILIYQLIRDYLFLLIMVILFSYFSRSENIRGS